MPEFMLLLVSLGVTLITSVGFLVIFGLLGAGFLTPLFFWVSRSLTGLTTEIQIPDFSKNKN